MRLKLCIQKIFSYLIVISLVLSCRSLLSLVVGVNTITILCVLVVFIGIICDCLVQKKISINIQERNLFIILSLHVVTCSLLICFGDFRYLSFIIVQLVYVILLCIWFIIGDVSYNIKLFINAFVNVICAISVVSLFFYVFATSLELLQPTITYSAGEVGWGPFSYRVYGYLYNDGQDTYIFGNILLRNIGIFVEAPMFSYVLVIALYFEVFLNNANMKKILILIVTILSTMSTTGIVFALLFLYIKFKSIIKNNTIIKVLMVPIIFIVVLLAVGEILSDKLLSGNMSGSTRIDDQIAAFKSFIHSPILGSGYENSRAMDPFRSGYRATMTWANKMTGLSTGLGGILSNGGILWGWFFVSPVFVTISRFVKKSEVRNWFGFIPVSILLLSVTVVHVVPIGPAMTVIGWIIIFKFSN